MDTIFVLGALTTSTERHPTGWNDLHWYYDQRIPAEARQWLDQNSVPHTIGWDRLAPRNPQYPSTIVAFLVIHDPNAALECRLRWSARITPSFAEMHRVWEAKGRITLAFGKPEIRV